jgi:hypothetical protein
VRVEDSLVLFHVSGDTLVDINNAKATFIELVQLKVQRAQHVVLVEP